MDVSLVDVEVVVEDHHGLLEIEVPLQERRNDLEIHRRVVSNNSINILSMYKLCRIRFLLIESFIHILLY